MAIKLSEMSYQTVWIISLAFTIPTLLLSFIWLHRFVSKVEWIRRRRLNTSVVRILLMVPIYSITSWLGLRFPEAALYLRTARECYEALALYSFFIMLILVLGGHAPLVRILEQQPPQEHLWPFCHVKPFEPGRHFLWHTEFGTLQFVVIKPILSGISFICSALGVFGEGRFAYNVAYPYVSFIASVSQAYALYSLILFYFAVKDELKPVRPVPKFMAIKMIIFFTYWQGVLVAILLDYGWIQDNDKYSAFNVASQLQEFLICVEMFFFALFHIVAFKPEDFDHVVVTRPRRRRRVNPTIVHHHHHVHHHVNPALTMTPSTTGKLPQTEFEMNSQQSLHPSYSSLGDSSQKASTSHHQRSQHRHHHHHVGGDYQSNYGQGDIALEMSNMEQASERALVNKQTKASASKSKSGTRKPKTLSRSSSSRSASGASVGQKARMQSSSTAGFELDDEDDLIRSGGDVGEGFYRQKRKLKSSEQLVDDDEDVDDDDIDNAAEEFDQDNADFEEDDEGEQDETRALADYKPMIHRDIARSDEPSSMASQSQPEQRLQQTIQQYGITPSQELPTYMRVVAAPKPDLTSPQRHTIEKPSSRIVPQKATMSVLSSSDAAATTATTSDLALLLDVTQSVVQAPAPAVPAILESTQDELTLSPMLSPMANPLPAASEAIKQSIPTSAPTAMSTSASTTTTTTVTPIVTATPAPTTASAVEGTASLMSIPQLGPSTTVPDSGSSVRMHEDEDEYFDEFDEEDEYEDDEITDEPSSAGEHHGHRRRHPSSTHRGTAQHHFKLHKIPANQPGIDVPVGVVESLDASVAIPTSVSESLETGSEHQDVNALETDSTAAATTEASSATRDLTANADQALASFKSASTTSRASPTSSATSSSSQRKSRDRGPPNPLRYLYDAVNVTDIARDAQSVYVRREAAGRRRTKPEPTLTVGVSSSNGSGEGTQTADTPAPSPTTQSPLPPSSPLPDVSAQSLHLARSPSHSSDSPTQTAPTETGTSDAANAQNSTLSTDLPKTLAEGTESSTSREEQSTTSQQANDTTTTSVISNDTK